MRRFWTMTLGVAAALAMAHLSADGAAAATAPASVPAADGGSSPRRTPLAELYRRALPSVVTITATRTERQPAATQPAAGGPASGPGDATRPAAITHTERGTGFLIHGDGFLLTTSHGLRHGGRLEAEFADGRRYRARQIARDDTRDVALLKIGSRGGPLPALRIGRSDDLMVGEPAWLIGNPFGFGLSLGHGVVTGLNRGTKTDFTLLKGAIQTNAGINPGASGGPLLNALGEVIGLCVSQKRDGDGIGFAVAADDIRAGFGEMISAEQRFGFLLGLEVAEGGPGGAVRVARVVGKTPAAAAGVRQGDEVLAVGGLTIRDIIDFHLALVDRTAARKLPLKLRRDGRELDVVITLGPMPLRPAERVEGPAPGLDFAAYRGRWDRLPDFSTLRPAAAGTVRELGLGDWAGRDGFALEFRGFLKAPADGLYLLYLESDDGSRLWVGDQLVVDHDGLHEAGEKRGMVRLRAGLHPIRAAFFDAAGQEALEVRWEGPGIRKQPIPASVLFRAAPAAVSAPATSPGV